MNLNLLKGILIILVIMDHNEFSRAIFPGFFNGFSFHVIGFLTMPFLREKVHFSSGYISRNFFRLYYPFFLLTCLMSSMVLIVAPEKTLADVKYLVWALYSGDAFVLKTATGMALLWFLPCLFSLLIVKGLLDKSSSSIKWLTLLVITGIHPFVGSIGREAQAYFPLGLLPALYAFPLCIAIVFLQRYVYGHIEKRIALVLATVLFGMVKYGQISLGLSQEIGFVILSDYTSSFDLLVNDLEAITGAMMVLQIARFSLWGFIERCGKCSMQIYLIHAFVALIIYKLISRFGIDISPVVGFIISMSATVLLSTLISENLLKNKVIKRYIFPRNFQELVGCKHEWSNSTQKIT